MAIHSLQRPVSLVQIIFMRFRKVNPGTIVTARITARKAGIEVTGDELEAHYLAGGNVVRVVQAIISANKANIELSYDRCCAIDLAGRDAKEAVDTSVNPKVIDVPSGTMARSTIDAIAGRRDPAQGEGSGHGANQPGAAGRRRHRGDGGGPGR